jgi:UDP-2,3-diacylglucosamine hydrolase
MTGAAGAAAGDAQPVLFVSDVHLSASRPEMVAAFHRFLERDALEARALYILGDLFDLWVGDDDLDPVSIGAMDALAALARRGVQVRLMHGNRDFLFGRAGARRANVTLIDDPTRVELFGVPTLLMHGDTLCTDDRRYLELRARYRRPWIMSAFRTLPRGVRAGIGQKLRRKSEQAKQSTPREVMDANPDAVAAVLRAHDYPRLIHGHTHRPARHEHMLDGRVCERWVLADWYTHGSYLRVAPDGLSSISVE